MLTKCNLECNSCTANFNPVLKGLIKHERETLDQHRNTIQVDGGELIFREGLFPSGLFCLRKGKAMVLKTDKEGNRIVLSLHREVTFLGVADYFSNKAYQSRCIALEKSELCIISSEGVNRFLNENRNFARRIISSLTEEQHRINNKLLSLTTKHMSARLADALIELLRVFGTDDKGRLDISMRRSDLALLCNMSISNTIRQLSDFRKSGIISTDGKRIEILNIAKLNELRAK